MNKSIILYIFYLSVYLTNLSFSKVLIFTYAYNRPDFIEIQYKTFKKFLKDDYEYVVFNDSPVKEMSKRIKAICNKYNIKCIDIPQEIHTKPYLERLPGRYEDKHQPSVRNCNVVQYSLDHYGFKHDDILALVDSDIFLLKNFSIREFLGDHDIGAFRRTCCPEFGLNCKVRHPGIPMVKYLWIGLVFLKMDKLPNKEKLNFNCGTVDERVVVDSGGYTHYYLRNNPIVKVKDILRYRALELICHNCRRKRKGFIFCNHNTNYLKKLKFSKENIVFLQSSPLNMNQVIRNLEFYLNDTWVHYRAGTNYNKLDQAYLKIKTKSFNKLIHSLLIKK